MSQPDFRSLLNERLKDKEHSFFIGWILVLSALAALLEVALGLAAFSLLMWVTMPWAFLDMIEKRKKRLPPHLEYAGDRPKEWLVYSYQLFLVSGIAFVVSALLTFTPPLPTIPDLYSLIFFVIGVTALALAFVEASRVIDFVVWPNEVAAITAVSTVRPLVYRLFIGFIGTYYLFADYVSFTYFQPPQPWNAYGAAIGVSLVLGFIAMIPTLWAHKMGRNSSLLVTFTFASPLLLVLFLGLTHTLPWGPNFWP
jgi:hypothetical protein